MRHNALSTAACLHLEQLPCRLQQCQLLLLDPPQEPGAIPAAKKSSTYSTERGYSCKHAVLAAELGAALLMATEGNDLSDLPLNRARQCFIAPKEAVRTMTHNTGTLSSEQGNML